MRLPLGGMSFKEFFLGLKAKLERDDVTDIAATVTFWGILAFFPFILFLVALFSLVITPADAEHLVRELGRVAPPEATQIIAGRIRDLSREGHTTLLGFGALGALWAAAGGTLSLMRALNTAYGVTESRPFWKVRLVALGMTLASGVVAFLAALFTVASGPLVNVLPHPLGPTVALLRLPLGGLLMMLLWALTYYVLPDVEQEFKFITPGSVLGVFLWVIACFGFSKYVDNFGHYDLVYGPLAGAMVLLLWMWMSALIVVLGAEVNALIEHSSPDRRWPGARRMADRGTELLPGEARSAKSKGENHPAEPSPVSVPFRGGLALLFGFLAGIFVARRRGA